jgi:hypothetical protein
VGREPPAQRTEDRFMKKMILIGLILAPVWSVALAQTNSAPRTIKTSTTSRPLQNHLFSPSTEAALQMPGNPRDVTSRGATTSPTPSDFDAAGHGKTSTAPTVTAAMRRLEASMVPGRKGNYFEKVRERIASGYYDAARDRAAFLPDESFSGQQMNILKTFLQ